ncbi:B3 domain-containing protein REM16-like isoform X2 [Papaver somniferum]|uniref:B3 domain-containing protein REM16-like isoform X2 n=1 Tax=Papaver somniferum TaxID=3469 RepID=UPI000E7013FF|nr:B3 domain-containing protein REM16-like isoform X2 [Papaver somniferum]
MNFFTFLPKNYHHHLLPKKFVKNCLMSEFPEIDGSTVSLKGPSGQTWTVELKRKDESKLYLKKGWEIFVKEHNLKENDALFFKYRSGGIFDVLMFDDGDFCEKESSYFVRNCQGCHRSTNGGLNEGRRVESEPRRYNEGENEPRRYKEGENEPRRSEEEESEPSIEIIEPKRLRYTDKPITISDEEQEEDADRETPRLLGREREPVCYGRRLPKSVPGCQSKAIVRTTEVSFTGENSEDEETEVNQVSPLAIALQRRTVHAKEIHLPYKQAVREGKRRGTPHFVVLIQPSHVSGICFMVIPIKSARKYLPYGSDNISLKMNGKTWQAQYTYYGRIAGFRGPGWKKFVLKNKLEVGNACLFEKTTSSATSSRATSNSITFSVSIFRNGV